MDGSEQSLVELVAVGQGQGHQFVGYGENHMEICTGKQFLHPLGNPAGPCGTLA